MSQLHQLKRIRLSLARSKEHPQGTESCGYELVAPLDQQGRVDLEGWKKIRHQCSVRRFWDHEADKIGKLVHKSGGANGATWVFDYDQERLDDDEAGYRFDTHRFSPGEYVTLRDQHGSHTFGVTAVEEADIG
jgi:hypothetical protein